MNLFNFVDFVSAHILERGKRYFDQERVGELTKTSTGYKTFVTGSSVYEVVIDVTNDCDIDQYSCTCQDEFNRPCKHVTACLFAIAEERKIPIFLEEEDDDFDLDPDSDEEIDVEWKDLLMTATMDELVRALLAVAKTDPNLRENIANVVHMNRIADSHWMRIIDRMEQELDEQDPEWEEGSDELYEAFEQLTESVSKITDPLEFLEMTRRFLDTTNRYDDVFLYPDFLHNMKWEFFGLWHETLAHCFHQTSFDQKQSFIREFWDEFESDSMGTLEFWENHWFDLLDGMFHDADVGQIVIEKYRRISLELDQSISKQKAKDWLFERKSLFDFQWFSAEWTFAELKSWLDCRLDILNLRLERLKIHFEDGEFEAMLHLMENYSGPYPTVKEESFRIAALSKLERFEPLRELIRRQFNRGNDANLEIYLSSFPEQKRASVYESLLDEWMSETDSYHMLRKRLISEGRKDRIIRAIELHPSWMNDLYDEVDVQDYPRLEMVFRTWVVKTMAFATDRKEYQKIAHKMAKIGTLFPNVTRELMLELIGKYPKRRAMIDELRRAIG